MQNIAWFCSITEELYSILAWCMFYIFCKIGLAKKIKTEQNWSSVLLLFLCRNCTRIYEQNYCSMDKPDVTHGQIERNRETEHLSCRKNCTWGCVGGDKSFLGKRMSCRGTILYITFVQNTSLDQQCNSWSTPMHVSGAGLFLKKNFCSFCSSLLKVTFSKQYTTHHALW